MISFIWAEDKAHHIGYKGKLPWNLPADLAYFKEKTLGHTIVMGKKTFDSLPGILPNRKHVVLTHDQKLTNDAKNIDRLEVFNDLTALKIWLKSQKEEIFVIGGASLFKNLVEDVDRLYLTKIEQTFNGDTFMTKIDYDNFKLISQVNGKVDEKNIYLHKFYVYEKK